MKRLFPFIFILLLLGIRAYSQHEYLAEVDPSTGSYTKFDSIPGVMYVLLYQFTIVDKNNNRVVFIGGPSQTQFSLVTLNAANGQVLSKVALPGYTNLIAFCYSSTGNLLYGVTVQSGVYSLVIVNLQTGNYSVIGTLAIDEMTEMVMDDLHNVIYLHGLLNGIPQLFTINTRNGATIEKVASGIDNLVYDSSKGKLYGTTPDNIFGSLDPATGFFTPIKALPSEITGITQGDITYDEKGQLYIFTANDNEGQTFLYSINATNGGEVYKAPVSLTNNVNSENLVQFRFDNASQTLYALHWEPKMNMDSEDSSCGANLKIQVYPNPLSNVLIITKTPSKCQVRLNLFNSLGQLLITGKAINDGQNELKLNYLPGGVYFYEFYSKRDRLRTGKIVKIK